MPNQKMHDEYSRNETITFWIRNQCLIPSSKNKWVHLNRQRSASTHSQTSSRVVLPINVHFRYLTVVILNGSARGFASCTLVPLKKHIQTCIYLIFHYFTTSFKDQNNAVHPILPPILDAPNDSRIWTTKDEEDPTNLLPRILPNLQVQLEPCTVHPYHFRR